jgi:hypothetical protein
MLAQRHDIRYISNVLIKEIVMNVLVNEIQVFAVKFGVPPAVAMMLPAVFHQGAEEAGMTAGELVIQQPTATKSLVIILSRLQKSVLPVIWAKNVGLTLRRMSND